LIPVAAIAPTILSSSHLLPVPIAPVSVAIYGWEEACSYVNTHLGYRTAGLLPSANLWFHQAKLEIESAQVLCCIGSFALTFNSARA